MKNYSHIFIFILFILFSSYAYGEIKESGNYKSSISFNTEKNSDNRYEVIIESTGELRFLLCKDYKTAFNCYYAIALYAQTDLNTDVTEVIPSIIDTLKEQGHQIKKIEDGYRGNYHGIAYNID